MDPLRLVHLGETQAGAPCSRCGQTDQRWDRIASRPICPQCEEALILGEGPPLIERAEKRRCAVCHKLGTLRYVTVPLQASRAIEIDLCGEHLRALLARRLGPLAFQQLRRQLQGLHVHPQEVFLLHDAFYDPSGRALQPAFEGDV